MYLPNIELHASNYNAKWKSAASNRATDHTTSTEDPETINKKSDSNNLQTRHRRRRPTRRNGTRGQRRRPLHNLTCNGGCVMSFCLHTLAD